MAYTIKPLSKIYKLKDVVDDIILWLRKETQKELDPEFVKKLVNLSVMDVAEILSGAGSDDYGKTANINDQSSSVTTNIVQNAYYTDSSRNINKSSHGLTVNDVGKRIILWESTNRAAIAEIEEIIDNNNFKITKYFGIDATINYAVFSSHSSYSIDISGYKIAQITKITDSLNHEVIEVGDKEYDNLYRFPTKQNKIYYYKHGQTLYLYKGTQVNNIGELTMYYNSYPQQTEEWDDYLDIKDMYVPLVILKAKNFCLDHLGMTAPESLTNVIDQKTREIRENIQREKEIANLKNQGKLN